MLFNFSKISVVEGGIPIDRLKQDKKIAADKIIQKLVEGKTIIQYGYRGSETLYRRKGIKKIEFKENDSDNDAWIDYIGSLSELIGEILDNVDSNYELTWA